METFIENSAQKLIKESTCVPIPDNQLGMSDYYNKKISYLRDAINLLETQIKEYLRERSTWDVYEGCEIDNL